MAPLGRARNPGQARRSRLLAAVAVVVVAPVLGGCLGSDYHYVKSSSDKTYFKVPKDWKLFDEDALLAGQKAELSDEEFEAVKGSTWRVMFDASPSPSLRHAGDLLRPHPTGIAVVRPLGGQESDETSIASLRKVVVDVDAAVEKGAGEVTAYERITHEGGIHGIDMTVRIAFEDGVATMRQIALVDAATTKLYLLVVSCRASCFERNRSEINGIVDSWTVKD